MKVVKSSHAYLLFVLMFPILEDKLLWSFPSTAMHVKKKKKKKKKDFPSLHFIFVQGTINDEIGDMIIAVVVCWVLTMNQAME